MSKPPLPASGSNVDRSFQLFSYLNGSPISQIQLLQSSLQGAVSNVRSFQSPIISTNSPPHSQNQLSSTPIAHVNSLGSTSLPLPNQPTSASAYISRAELFNILDNYVQKSEFQRLQGRYEKLKRKIAQNSTAFEDDEYYQSIESFGNDKMYEATLQLMEKAFTNEEIRNHSISGRRANSKITVVKPQFSPNRFNKVCNALKKKFPDINKDQTIITKKVQSVQKKKMNDLQNEKEKVGKE